MSFLIKMSKLYKLEPELSKSSFEIEEYSKKIEDVFVTISISTLFRWSEFEINLTDKQKEKILQENGIILKEDDFEYEFVSANDGLKQDLEILDEKKYSSEFIEKIDEHIYGPDDDPYDNALNELEENGWTPGDVSYRINCKINLEEIDS